MDNKPGKPPKVQTGALQKAIVALDDRIPDDSIRVLLHYIAKQYDEALLKQQQTQQRVDELTKKLKRRDHRDQIYRTLLNQHQIDIPSNVDASPSGSESGSDGYSDDNAMSMNDNNHDRPNNSRQPSQQSRQPSSSSTKPNQSSRGRQSSLIGSDEGNMEPRQINATNQSTTSSTRQTPSQQQQQQHNQQQRNQQQQQPRQQHQQQQSRQQQHQQQDQQQQNKTIEKQHFKKPIQYELPLDLLASPSTITESSTTSIYLTPNPVSFRSAADDATDPFTYYDRNLAYECQNLPLPPFTRHAQFIARFSQFILDLYTISQSIALSRGGQDVQDVQDDGDDDEEEIGGGTIFTHLQGEQLNIRIIAPALVEDFNWLVTATKQFYNSYTYLCALPLIIVPVIAIKYNNGQIVQDEKNNNQSISKEHRVIEPTPQQQNHYWEQVKELYHVVMAVTLLICDVHARDEQIYDLAILDMDDHEEFVPSFYHLATTDDIDDEDEDAEDEEEEEEEDVNNDDNKTNNSDEDNEDDEKKSTKKKEKITLTPTQQLRKASHNVNIPSIGLHFESLSKHLRSTIPLTPLYDYHPFEMYFQSLEKPYEKHTRRLLNVIDTQGNQTKSLNKNHQVTKNQLSDEINSTLTAIPSSLSLILNSANFLMYKNSLLSVMLGLQGDDDVWWDHFFGLLSTPLADVQFTDSKKDEEGEENENNMNNNVDKSPPTIPLVSTPTPEQVTMTILTFWFFSSIPLNSLSSIQRFTSDTTSKNSFIVAKHSQQLSHITQLITDLNQDNTPNVTNNKKKSTSFHNQHNAVDSTSALVHSYRTDIIRELAVIQFSILLNSLLFSHQAHKHHYPRPIDLALTSTASTILQRYQNTAYLHIGCPFEFTVTTIIQPTQLGLSKDKKPSTLPQITPPTKPSSLTFSTPRFEFASQIPNTYVRDENSQITPIFPIIYRSDVGSVKINEATANLSTLIPTLCHCCTNHLVTQIFNQASHVFKQQSNLMGNDHDDEEEDQKRTIHPLFQIYDNQLTELTRFSMAFKQQILFKLLSLSNHRYYRQQTISIQSNSSATIKYKTIQALDTTGLYQALTLTQMVSQYLLTTTSWHHAYMLLKHTVFPWYSSVIHTIALAGATHTQCQINTQQFVISTMQFVFLVYSLIPQLYNFISYGPTSLPSLNTTSGSDKLPFTHNQVSLVFTLLTQLEIFLDTFILSLRSIANFTSIIQYDSMRSTADDLVPIPIEVTTPIVPRAIKATSFYLPELQVELVHHLRRYIAILNGTFIGSSEQYRSTTKDGDAQATNNDHNTATTTTGPAGIRNKNDGMDALPVVSLDPHTSTPSITLTKIFIQHTDVMRELINASRDDVDKTIKEGNGGDDNDDDDEDPFILRADYETKFEFINHYLRSKAKHDDYLNWITEQRLAKQQRSMATAQKRSDNLAKARSLRHAAKPSTNHPTTTTTTTGTTTTTARTNNTSNNATTSSSNNSTTDPNYDELAPRGPKKRLTVRK